MNTNNIALTVAGSTFLGVAVDLANKNLWMAIAAALVGIVCWVAYDYLP